MGGKLVLISFVALATFGIDSVLGGTVPSTRQTCTLYIRTDPTLWRHVREGIPDHEDPSKASKVDRRTRFEIIELVSNHIKTLNSVFGNTTFNGRYEHGNIQFQLQKLKIDTLADCSPNAYTRSPFCQENLESSTLLHTFAEENSEDFCLAFLFTYRDYHLDHLGKTYTAKPHGMRGGICMKYQTVTYSWQGVRRVRKLSVNTGFITLLLGGKPVAGTISQLNFVRHVAIGFGAEFEDDDECDELSNDCPEGYHVMNLGLWRTGKRPNNSKFSPSSIEKISAVLDAVQDGKKRNCFVEKSGSFCGNYMVEDGEECDCGYDDVECKDKCCYPRSISEYDRERNVTAKPCTRRANTQCSPSQGSCCRAETCELIPASLELAGINVMQRSRRVLPTGVL